METKPEVSLDERNARGTAHPIRVQILAVLRTEGPATASTMARRLDLSSGATSYHLRQLFEYGFIEEVPARGVRRERWWKAAHASTVAPQDLYIDHDGIGITFLQSIAQVATHNMMRAVEATSALTPAWRDAQDFSDYMFPMTPNAARELAAELHGVLKRHSAHHRQAPPPADAVVVTFQFQMFPSPEDPRAHHDESQERDAGERR